MPILTSITQAQQSSLLSKTALIRWVGGVSLAILCQSSFAGNCVRAFAGGSLCECLDASGTSLSSVTRDGDTGMVTAEDKVKQCTSALSNDACTSVIQKDITAVQYYKNMSPGATDYYSCGWNSDFDTPVHYDGLAPAPVSAPIDLIFGKQSQTFAAEINVK